MLTKMTIEIELPDDATVVDLHDINYELMMHIDAFRSDLPIAKNIQVHLPKELSLKLR